MLECIDRRSVFVEAQLFANIRRQLHDHGVDRYPQAVGDAIVLGEIRGDGGRGGHRRRAQALGQGATRLVQPGPLGTDYRIGERQQQVAAGHTDIQFGPDEGLEIDVQVGLSSTLTEEPGMTGGSEKEFVERRHPPRDDLHL